MPLRYLDIEVGNYIFKISKGAKTIILNQGYDPKFGARPLKRAIQKYIEDLLAEEIIKSNISEGDTITITVNNSFFEIK